MQPQFVTRQCNHCNGNIEFDASQFEPGETRQVECPHCHSETTLFVPRSQPPPPPLQSPPLVENPKLRRCADCGKEVSIRAESCPHCGATFIIKKRHGVFFYVFWGVVGTGLIITAGRAFLSSVFEAAVSAPPKKIPHLITEQEVEDAMLKSLHPSPLTAQEKQDAQMILKHLHRSEDEVLRITFLKPFWVGEEDRKVEATTPPFYKPTDRIYLYIVLNETFPDWRRTIPTNDTVLRLKIEYAGERMLIKNFVFRIDDSLETIEPKEPFFSARYSIKGQYNEPAMYYLDVIEKIAKGQKVLMRYEGSPYSHDHSVSTQEKTSFSQMLLVYRYLREQAKTRP